MGRFLFGDAFICNIKCARGHPACAGISTLIDQPLFVPGEAEAAPASHCCSRTSGTLAPTFDRPSTVTETSGTLTRTATVTLNVQ